MFEENEELPAQKAEIKTIGEEVKTRITQKGEKQYVICTVTFLEGNMEGKKFFAQRTLGENKNPIEIGQEVYCYPRVVETDGKRTVFFEISTSTVDSVDDILKALGVA